MFHSIHRIGILIALPAAIALVAPASAEPAQKCPSWVQSPDDFHANRPSPDLGCSNRENLGQMVEDPNDLKQGKDLAPADSQRESDAVKRYEEGHVKTATPAPSSFGGVLVPSSPMGGPQ